MHSTWQIPHSANKTYSKRIIPDTANVALTRRLKAAYFDYHSAVLDNPHGPSLTQSTLVIALSLVTSTNAHYHHATVKVIQSINHSLHYSLSNYLMNWRNTFCVCICVLREMHAPNMPKG